MASKKIGVLMGGTSSEREISLRTGAEILAALQRRGLRAVGLDVGPDAAQRLLAEGIQVAFIALHGGWGENGAIQGLLEVMGIPYTGSGPLASALGMHKLYSRKLFAAEGLPVPAYWVQEGAGGARHAVPPRLPDPLPFPPPYVVKPAAQGSSVGVRLVHDLGALAEALQAAWSLDPVALVETYIQGREVQVGVLGKRALGAIEIVPKASFYTYEAKYQPGQSEHHFPARLPQNVYEAVLDLGLRAHRALGCRGYSRVDLLVDSQNRPVVLEVNTLPGMTATSLFPEIARGVGISFDDLVETVLKMALLEREGLSHGQVAETGQRIQRMREGTAHGQ